MANQATTGRTSRGSAPASPAPVGSGPGVRDRRVVRAVLAVSAGRVVECRFGDDDLVALGQASDVASALAALGVAADRAGMPTVLAVPGEPVPGVLTNESTGVAVRTITGGWLPGSMEDALAFRDAAPDLAEVDASGLFDLPAADPSAESAVAPVDASLGDLFGYDTGNPVDTGNPDPVTNTVQVDAGAGTDDLGTDDLGFDESFVNAASYDVEASEATTYVADPARTGDNLSRADLEAWADEMVFDPSKASDAGIRTGAPSRSRHTPRRGRVMVLVAAVVAALALVSAGVFAVFAPSGPSIPDDPRFVAAPVPVVQASVDAPPGHSTQAWSVKLGRGGSFAATPVAVVVAGARGLDVLNPDTGKRIARVKAGRVDLVASTRLDGTHVVAWQSGKRLFVLGVDGPVGKPVRLTIPDGLVPLTRGGGVAFVDRDAGTGVLLGGTAARPVWVKIPAPGDGFRVAWVDDTTVVSTSNRGSVRVDPVDGDAREMSLETPVKGLVLAGWVAATPRHTVSLWSETSSAATGGVGLVVAIHDVVSGRMVQASRTTWGTLAAADSRVDASSQVVAYGPWLVDAAKGEFLADGTASGVVFGFASGGLVRANTSAVTMLFHDGGLYPISSNLMAVTESGVAVMQEPGSVVAGYAADPANEM